MAKIFVGWDKRSAGTPFCVCIISRRPAAAQALNDKEVFHVKTIIGVPPLRLTHFFAYYISCSLATITKTMKRTGPQPCDPASKLCWIRDNRNSVGLWLARSTEWLLLPLRQLPQHRMQNPSVAVVHHFNRCIDPARRHEVNLVAVRFFLL